MSNIINYEVYVYENNAWDLLARYPSEKRTEAIEYAKSVEFSHNKPTKVIRETYDLDTQKFQESLIYLSEYTKVSNTNVKKKQVQIPVKPIVFKETKREITTTEAFAKLFIVIALSLGGSGLMATVFLKGISEIGYNPSNLSSNFIFGIFILFFLLLSVPMSLKWVPWEALNGTGSSSQQTKKNSSSTSETASDSEKNDSPESQTSERPVSQGISKAFFRIWDHITGTSENEASPESAVPVREPEPEPIIKELAPLPSSADTLPPEPAEETFIPPQMSASKENKEAVPNVSAQPAQAQQPQEDKTAVPKKLEKDHMRLTTFLAALLKIMQQKNVQLDTYARFGIALFISGACEQVSKKHSLLEDESKTLLCSLLEVMGTSKVISELFYEKIVEYALEPKYLPVIQGGSNAMEAFMQNPPSSEFVGIIQQTMGKWLSPEKDEMQQSGIVTVMFTDMVGSTHFTQTVGDKLAQQLIRKHNTIVRQALSTCNGREIKLTGDGTMASFSSASNAVDAAIAIQKAVARYNRQSPTVPLEIRIGLNAGEPIVEENDLYGTMVQVASRICNLAEKDQIFISNVVKELSAGKHYLFDNLGTRELKGINEPQMIYEVLWRNEPATAPEPADTEQEPDSGPRERPLESALPEF